MPHMSSDGRRRFSRSELGVPHLPGYEVEAIARLHEWADAIAEETRREWLNRYDYEEISSFLRRIAASDIARRALFPAEKRKRGRPPRHSAKTHLVALEYWVRRELSRIKGGREKLDRHATVCSWEEWGITGSMLDRVRTGLRNSCERIIERQIKACSSSPDPASRASVLADILDSIDAIRSRFTRTP